MIIVHNLIDASYFCTGQPNTPTQADWLAKVGRKSDTIV